MLLFFREYAVSDMRILQNGGMKRNGRCCTDGGYELKLQKKRNPIPDFFE